MKINRLHMAVLAAMLGSAALAGCKKKEEPAALPPAAETTPAPAPAPAPVAATAQVTSVDLGNAVGGDQRVTAPMSTFGPKDTIYAAVSTSTSDPAASVGGKLGAKWTHVDSNQVVSEEAPKDITFTGDGVTDFQISKPSGWPTGKYKVEISLEGNVVQTREFEVK